jgi:branched-chain amino acid transport system ATP-binding protein
MKALTVDGLSAGYAGVPAVRELNVDLDEGEILAVVGPNGAGKTTTLLTLAGFLRPIAGEAKAFGHRITGSAPHQVARFGVNLIPDNRGLFPNLTVEEHFRLAQRSPVKKGRHGLSLDQVLERFPQLKQVAKRRCGLLSGGEQQMLAIGKALLLAPRVLMVDELSLGLAPAIVQGLLPALREVSRELGMSVVVVEQHFELALAVAHKAIVLNHGSVVLSGSAADLLSDRTKLEAAYFGVATPSDA